MPFQVRAPRGTGPRTYEIEGLGKIRLRGGQAHHTTVELTAAGRAAAVKAGLEVVELPTHPRPEDLAPVAEELPPEPPARGGGRRKHGEE